MKLLRFETALGSVVRKYLTAVVELGVSDGGLIAVRGNLQPGDKVVVQGNERLIPMSPVLITKEIDSMAQAE